MVGASEGSNVTYSTRTSVLWKGAESPSQHEPKSWWNPMFDSDITVCRLLTCKIVLTTNLTPRKCLGFKTPFQALIAELGKDIQIRFS